MANVALSPSRAVEGPWMLLGPLEPKAVENVQVLRIDGVWQMLATSVPLIHRPIPQR